MLKQAVCNRRGVLSRMKYSECINNRSCLLSIEASLRGCIRKRLQKCQAHGVFEFRVCFVRAVLEYRGRISHKDRNDTAFPDLA
jgi:hypothetical protein